ncbi:MAG: hypothetical protein AAB289_05875 [Chloroflexota bacterium]
MATKTAAPTKPRAKRRPALLDNGLLAALREAGEVDEVRFELKRVRLADGEYHELVKPVQVKLQWDKQVGYFIATDNKTTHWGEGDTAIEALSDYLNDWKCRLESLEDEEAVLGKALLQDLALLRRLLGIPTRHAS